MKELDLHDGYHLFNDNCSTFASETWLILTGEYLSPSNGFIHTPNGLGNSIFNANYSSHDNVTNDYQVTSNRHASSSSTSSSFGVYSSRESSNLGSSTSLPESSGNSSINSSGSSW